MLKAVEVGLLAVSFLVFLGLIVSGPARRRNRVETDAARIARDEGGPQEPEGK